VVSWLKTGSRVVPLIVSVLSLALESGMALLTDDAELFAGVIAVSSSLHPAKINRNNQ